MFKIIAITLIAIVTNIGNVEAASCEPEVVQISKTEVVTVVKDTVVNNARKASTSVSDLYEKTKLYVNYKIDNMTVEPGSFEAVKNRIVYRSQLQILELKQAISAARAADRMEEVF